MISSLVGTAAASWERLHRNSTILPESFVEIEYWITEAGAQELASESNNGALFYSKHSEILETAGEQPLVARWWMQHPPERKS